MRYQSFFVLAKINVYMNVSSFLWDLWHVDPMRQNYGNWSKIMRNMTCQQIHHQKNTHQVLKSETILLFSEKVDSKLFSTGHHIKNFLSLTISFLTPRKKDILLCLVYQYLKLALSRWLHPYIFKRVKTLKIIIYRAFFDNLFHQPWYKFLLAYHMRV